MHYRINPLQGLILSIELVPLNLDNHMQTTPIFLNAILSRSARALVKLVTRDFMHVVTVTTPAPHSVPASWRRLVGLDRSLRCDATSVIPHHQPNHVAEIIHLYWLHVVDVQSGTVGMYSVGPTRMYRAECQDQNTHRSALSRAKNRLASPSEMPTVTFPPRPGVAAATFHLCTAQKAASGRSRRHTRDLDLHDSLGFE